MYYCLFIGNGKTKEKENKRGRKREKEITREKIFSASFFPY
jgi:hypothetical protein